LKSLIKKESDISMHIFKKYKYYMLILALTMLISSSTIGCNWTNSTIDETTNGERIISINGNDDTPEFKMEEKSDVLLLFLIDEGIGGVELILRYKDDMEALDEALDNVYTGLKPLTQGYDVGVLIYPHYHYKIEGYGHMPGDPLDRISPELLYALDYFKSKGDIKVYLEILSSGIYSNQNGEWGILNPAPLYANDPNDKTVKGLPVDMDTLSAIKQAYPNTFEGVRFHEIIASQHGAKDDSSAFTIQPEAIKTIVDTCKNNDLKLVWADPFWDIDYKPGQRKIWNTLVDYATENLKENVTFLWANNSFGIESSLGYRMGDINVKEKSQWGISVQSWAWVSIVGSNWKWWNHENNYKFYSFIDDGMPIDLMASYTLMGIEQGASVIQYEPSWYFFNFHNPLWLVNEIKRNPFAARGEGYTGMYEQAPDYSARLALKRLVSILLDPTNPNNPSSNVMDYFGGEVNQEIWWSNFESDPLEKYNQTTLNIYNSDGYRRHFDFYNNSRSWVEQNQYRFGDWIFSGDVFAAERINLYTEPHDEMLIVKEKDGERIVEFYNQRSGLMGTDNKIAADNEEGKFIGITTANLISQYITSLDGDPDEIIVIRKKEGQENLNIRIYKVTNGLRAHYLDFGITALSDEENSSLIKEYITDEKIASDSFVAISGLRFGHTIYSNGTRRYDGVVLLTKSSGELKLNVRKFGVDTSINVGSISSGNIFLTTADINNDYSDEICLLKVSEDNMVIESYKFDENGIKVLEEKTLDSQDRSPRIFFSLKKSTYNNASTNLKKPDLLIEGDNLALNAMVEMDSNPRWGNIAENVVDGNYGTIASAEIGIMVRFIIDLGESREVNRVAVVTPKWSYAAGYTISVSEDGNNWIEVATENAGISEVRFIYDFQTTNARYIRFQTTRIHGENSNVSQIEVFRTKKS